MSSNEFKVPDLPVKSPVPPKKEISGEIPPNGTEVPKLPYKKPEWSALPKKDYSMEIIKNGVIIDTFNIPDSEEFIVLGRLPLCDVQMDHPSISRYHAVIQFSNKGMPFLYDLGSAHGTFLNKNVLPPNQYIPLHVGDMIKFGQSTRIYIFQGPNEEEIQKSEEMYEKYQEMKKKKLDELNKKNVEEEDEGISWGFGEDATEETIEKMEDIRSDYKPNENAFYYKDPKKALRNWLENRGSEMEFQIAEETHSHAKLYIAKVILPLEDSYGPVSVTGSGLKKKDAEKEAALNACIKIDQYIGFKAPVREKKSKHNSDDESDNDTYYDRTGQVEKKKKLLQQKKSHKKEEVDTHETLIKKNSAIDEQILDIQKEIEEAKKQQLERNQHKEEDYDLDNYMNSLNESLNKKKIRPIHILNKELENLKKEKERIIKLLRITRPNIDIFSLMQQSKNESKKEENLNVTQNHDSSVSEKKVINENEKSSEKESNEKSVNSNKREYSEINEVSTSSEVQENKKQKVEKGENNDINDIDDDKTKDKNISNNDNNIEKITQKKEKKEKFKRKFGVVNKETSELLDNKIKEDIIDWLPPEQRDKEYNNMNAEYGY
ncbi:hypothetical protein LY90DRAFT_672780 [Neocallimastix californiae]|jgi:hypothetical protein|uniref:SMAD/FHA domain-containing protein n=1 Tax=Neocallimastix californiae TaxID=1754190 RepID=A0A1Y2BRX9_9FUNG|nr:hypothetical protein LY90DRAFT_672780 [Neocallimastix californiae]|eukprot:ORY37518.1 hypothetical protein LY90DRAFT_672780 [Neocallimastix californiae]